MRAVSELWIGFAPRSKGDGIDKKANRARTKGFFLLLRLALFFYVFLDILYEL